MFVSQVLFETDNDHEEKVKTIVKGKLAQVKDAPGLISAECWKKSGGKKAGYCMVNKWENKEYFTQWLGESHKDARGAGRKPDEKVSVSKAAVQYEVVDLE